jgi:hypothetical protein
VLAILYGRFGHRAEPGAIDVRRLGLTLLLGVASVTVAHLGAVVVAGWPGVLLRGISLAGFAGGVLALRIATGSQFRSLWIGLSSRSSIR